MANNLSDYEKLIYSFILKTLQEKYPAIATGSRSLVNDSLVNPHVEIIKPFLSMINDIDKRTILSNYDSIAEADLDKIGESNYFVSRLPGTQASGYVYIEFQNIPANSNITIASGTVVGKNDTYKYITSSSVTVTAADLTRYYDANKLVHSIPVHVVAEAVGTSYNAKVSEISKLYSVLQYSTGTVSNAVEINNGVDKESNEDYYLRIKEVYLKKNLGTNSGFKSQITENFPLVNDLYVAGKGDTLMNRDIVTDVVKGPIHIGGKVDLYIKGQSLVSYTDSFKVSDSDFYFKNVPIVENTVKVFNLTNTEALVTFTVSYDNLDQKGTELEGSKLTVTSGAVTNDELLITYSYTDSGGLNISTSENFYYDAYKTKLSNKPLFMVTNVINRSQVGQVLEDKTKMTEAQAVLSNTLYTISYLDSDVIGTVSEECIVTFSESPGNRTLKKEDGNFYPYYEAGDILEIVYSSNGLIKDIQDFYTEEENRVICTDVLVKPANKAYVYVSLNVKPKVGYSIGITEQAYITSIITNYINQDKFVSSIRVDELIATLKADATINSYLDYLEQPITFYDLDRIEETFLVPRPEIFTLTVNTGSSASGDMTVYLNGTPQLIAITSGKTDTFVAGVIKDFIHALTGYTATVNSNVVTVTGTTNRNETDATFFGGTTGVTATINVTQQGQETITKSSIVFNPTYYAYLQKCRVVAIG